jgi:hypothetical protein
MYDFGMGHESENERSRSYGLMDGFEGYRTPTKLQLSEAIKNALIVADANVLLDLYRYSETPRADLLEALRAVGPRLWVPNQAVLEFWKNRENVIRDPGNTRSLIATLQSLETQAVEQIQHWANQRSLDGGATKLLTNELVKSFTDARVQIEAHTDERMANWLRNTNEDAVLKQLEPILLGKVGPALSDDDLASCLVEGKRRIESKIPPGYLDAKKSGDSAVGDYLVWEQTIREAAFRKNDVLFISRDAKEDWIRRENGEIRGPRLELVNEMKKRAGVRLFIRTPDQFMQLAKEVLAVEISDKSVSDAAKLGKQFEASEMEFLKNSRWWQDATDWDAQAVDFFLEILAQTEPKVAQLLFSCALNQEPIVAKTLERAGFQLTNKTLRHMERALVEATEETARAGLLPAQANPPIRKLMRASGGGSASRVVGFEILPSIVPLINLVASVRDEAERLLPEGELDLNWRPPGQIF